MVVTQQVEGSHSLVEVIQSAKLSLIGVTLFGRSHPISKTVFDRCHSNTSYKAAQLSPLRRNINALSCQNMTVY